MYILPLRRRWRVVALAMILLLSACSKSGDQSFNSSQEALKGYNEFLVEVRHAQVNSGNDIVQLCRQWHIRRDSVVRAIERDYQADVQQGMTDCLIINDSICNAFEGHIDHATLTFSDYIDIREAFCDLSLKSEDLQLIAQYSQFFEKLDTKKPKAKGKNADIACYSTYLEQVSTNGFKTKNEVLNFIAKEDSLFRLFLTHLSSLGEASLLPIRKNTEIACRKVLMLPQSQLSHKKAVVLMTMRSNRRLLQNAEVCMTDAKLNRVYGGTQSKAYLWMLVQPLAALDDLSLTMMTSTQRVQLRQLAKELPSLAKRLQSSDDNDVLDTEKLPKLFTKAYLLGKK